MKLIDLLVQELPRRGGWPEKATQARQDADGEVCFWPRSAVYDFYPDVMSSDSAQWLEDNERSTSDLYVTREQYETSLKEGDKPEMKLIDLLVQELPKMGGWPRGVGYISMHDDGDVFRDGETWVGVFRGLSCSDGWRSGFGARYTNAVTESEYLSALELSKQPGWDGTGLPPIGAKIEVDSPRFGWTEAIVTAVTNNWIITLHEDGSEFAWVHRNGTEKDGWNYDYSKFRPIRTKSQLQREASIASLQEILKGSGYGLPDGAASIVLDAIAQGKVSGIKLAD